MDTVLTPIPLLFVPWKGRRSNLNDDAVLSTGPYSAIGLDAATDCVTMLTRQRPRSGSDYRARQIVPILFRNSDRSSSSRVSRFVRTAEWHRK